MKIPKFWIRREGDVPHPDGRELHLFAWGWSETSASDAEARAAERFRSLEQRVSQGLDLPRGYAYGDRPVREQIIEEIPGPDGQPAALLTRNTYGSVVLNAARAMFIDVDAAAAGTTGGGTGGFLKSLFGGDGGGSKPSDAQLDRLRGVLRSSGAGSFRVYRTAGGYRLLATDRIYTPGSSESESLMRQVGADPAFIQLCRIQDSFRARLTPKPWRIGKVAPPGDFPREDARLQRDFEKWLQEYDRAAGAKATCQFVETIGDGRIHTDVASIIQLHDERTRATTTLPLA
jgi:hypothetical protein